MVPCRRGSRAPVPGRSPGPWTGNRSPTKQGVHWDRDGGTYSRPRFVQKQTAYRYGTYGLTLASSHARAGTWLWSQEETLRLYGPRPHQLDALGGQAALVTWAWGTRQGKFTPRSLAHRRTVDERGYRGVYRSWRRASFLRVLGMSLGGKTGAVPSGIQGPTRRRSAGRPGLRPPPPGLRRPVPLRVRLDAIPNARHDPDRRHEHRDPDDTRRDALVPALAVAAVIDAVRQARLRPRSGAALVPGGLARRSSFLTDQVSRRCVPSWLELGSLRAEHRASVRLPQRSSRGAP